MNQTPLTNAAITRVLDNGFDVSQSHKPLIDTCRELELENAELHKYAKELEKWKDDGIALFTQQRFTIREHMFFIVGAWWADRPWRNRE